MANLVDERVAAVARRAVGGIDLVRAAGRGGELEHRRAGTGADCAVTAADTRCAA